MKEPLRPVWLLARAASIASVTLALACSRKATPMARVSTVPPTSSSVEPPPADPPSTRSSHAAEVDAPPPVDLATDVAARIADAHARFGDRARVRTVDETFVLVDAGRAGALFDRAAELLARALPRLLHGRFDKRLPLGVTVLLFGDANAYDRYCRARYDAAGATSLGVYRSEFREIALDVSGGPDFLTTLTHEAVHPIFQNEFPDAPLWFEEGVASLFEAPVFGADGSIHGEPRSRRQARLARALASETARPGVTLEALFAMRGLSFLGVRDGGAPDKPDQAARMLHYAMARAFAAWLDAQGKLWPFYRAWRDGAAADPTGEAAFAKVMGRAPAELTGEWVRWLR